jgi:hypothetical protein
MCYILIVNVSNVTFRNTFQLECTLQNTFQTGILYSHKIPNTFQFGIIHSKTHSNLESYIPNWNPVSTLNSKHIPLWNVTFQPRMLSECYIRNTFQFGIMHSKSECVGMHIPKHIPNGNAVPSKKIRKFKLNFFTNVDYSN